MSQLIDRVENHALKNTLDRFATQMTELKNEELTAEFFDMILRIELAIELLNKVYENVDPLLVPIVTLNNLNSNVEQANQHITNFLSTKNTAYINHAENLVDSILINTLNLKPPSTSEDVENLREYIGSFRKSVGQHNHNIEEEQNKLIQKSNKLNEEFTRLESRINTESQRIDSFITSAQQQSDRFQEQFSASEEGRRKTFAEELEKFHKGFEKLIDENTADSESLIKENESAFDGLKTKIQGDFKDVVDELKSKYKQEIDSLNKTVKTYIEEIEGHKTHVENLVGVITNTGMAYGFQKVANQEQISKIIWQCLTVLGIGGAIGFAIYASISGSGSNDTNMNWISFATKWAVAVAFGSLAAYTGKQAGNHALNEKRNRQMELILASIDTYLVGLDNKNEIKEALANKLFTIAEEPQITANEITNQNNDQNLINSADLIRFATEYMKLNPPR